MKFLTDQDVFALTTAFLNGLGHNVATAARKGCRPFGRALEGTGLTKAPTAAEGTHAAQR
jgi:hypothetical protein